MLYTTSQRKMLWKCIAVLFLIARKLETIQMSIKRWMVNLWFIHTLEYYSATKGTNYWCRQHRQISEILPCAKEARDKTVHSVWFHLHTILENTNFISDCLGLGSRVANNLLTGAWGNFRGDRNILYIGSGYTSIQICKKKKETFELYTKNGCLSLYVNYVLFSWF